MARLPPLRRRAPLALALVAALVAPASGADAQSSEQLWDRFEQASDAHAEAAEELAQLEEEVATVERALRRAEEHAAALAGDVRTLAIHRYVHASTTSIDALWSDAGDLAMSQGLTDVVLGVRSDSVDALDAVREDLARQQAALAATRAAQAAVVARNAETAAQLRAAAMAAARVEKELARRAAEEAARRAAERRAAELAAAERARAQARQAALQRQSRPTPPPPPSASSTLDPGGLTPEQLARLRQCESGGNYAESRNPRYRGAYQFHRSTWDRVALQAGRPDLVGVDPAAAAPADQDAMAQALYRLGGLRPWPSCARRV